MSGKNTQQCRVFCSQYFLHSLCKNMQKYTFLARYEDTCSQMLKLHWQQCDFKYFKVWSPPQCQHSHNNRTKQLHLLTCWNNTEVIYLCIFQYSLMAVIKVSSTYIQCNSTFQKFGLSPIIIKLDIHPCMFLRLWWVPTNRSKGRREYMM